MNVSRIAQPCLRLVAQRCYSNPGYKYEPKGPIHPGYIKIREKYKKFQVDDGVPIHLKGGTMDKVLYYTTLASCAVGVAWFCEYIYTSAFPKKS